MAKAFFSLDKPGMRGLALGNAAIARGAFEAGVILGSGYPGTPSTEILENFTQIAVENPEAGINVEWSINEKVGFEVAFGGSMCNARSIATMKHVGVNVAIDSFINACYAGARGGMVLISADDPLLHSSQNEQDNRFYGLQSLVPVFEPSNVQEAKDMMKYAYDFSEKFGTLVIFRTTTRLNHSRGDLTLGEIQKINRTYGFEGANPQQYLFSKPNAQQLRVRLLERLEKISTFAEEFPFNEKIMHPSTKVGIVAAGIPYAHALDAINLLGLEKEIALFKLGMVFPPPEQNLISFMKSLEKIIVIEELEPVIENMLKSIAFDNKIPIEIHGKSLFEQKFEIFPETIIHVLAKVFNKPDPIQEIDSCAFVQAPPRPPVLCAGCGHRNIYVAVKRVERRLRIRAIHSSDIGCYTLGFYEPLNGIDTCIAMGASIGMINGTARLDSRVSMAFLGDSTFFHSGIPGLLNAVHNHHNLIIVIMDNGSTSMTGHQDHPGTGVKIDKTPGQKINIATLVEGFGVPRKNIWVPDANVLNELEVAFEEAIKAHGVRVVIPTTMCSLQRGNLAKKKKIILNKFTIDTAKCCSKEYCIRTLGCPSISKEGPDVVIDSTACGGCSMCSQICPYYAISIKKIETPENEE
jgi:indolepyruvate ferredoxin oxidoreductase alpha subunit